VGKVRGVRLTGSADPNRVVQVIMRVETAFLRSIPLDSYAQIGADTMIGDQYIDISSGKMSRHVLGNAEIRYQPPTDVLKSLDLSQFEKQLRQIGALLTDIESGKGLVGQFVANEELYSSTVRSAKELEQGLTMAVSTTSEVGQVLYSDTLYRDVRRPMQDLDAALARMMAGQGDSGRLLRDSAQYDELRAQAGELRKSLAAIRAGEGAAGQLVTSDATWVALNRTVAAAIEAVDRFSTNPMFVTSATYDNLNGMAREFTAGMRDFRTSPEKFLRMKLF
jgi:phospholipid/cholesterol/gamma-HCH transport system substrate-binding protein